MRPDVAVAFDRMAAAAAAAASPWSSVSGFRSDAEQAALFAAHPDPPGWHPRALAAPLRDRAGPRARRGLRLAGCQRHAVRLSPALQLGAVARRVRRRPAPCSAAAEAIGSGGGGAVVASGSTPPSFVPARFRAPLQGRGRPLERLRGALGRPVAGGVELRPVCRLPGWRPGIAQFMPSTAASYGLDDPFDPVAAIEAQAHLMADLLRQLGSPELALAAYNAGPGAVEGCHCVPAIPETQAYVTRILALAGGSGALAFPSFEVRLVA